jgi:cytochrome c oxidase subunit 3
MVSLVLLSIITGLHGFHVIIGTIFIIVGYTRFLNYHFLSSQHLGFEFAVWYWHFVDLVWLFVFSFVYYWSSIGPKMLRLTPDYLSY